MNNVSEEIARASYLPILMQPKQDVYKKAVLSYNYTKDWKKNIQLEVLKKFKPYKCYIEQKLMTKINNLKEYELFRTYKYWALSNKIEKYKQQMANQHKNRKVKKINIRTSKESHRFYEIEKFLNHRLNSKGKPGSILVKWVGYNSSYNSWEPINHLRNYVPDLVDDYLNDFE